MEIKQKGTEGISVQQGSNFSAVNVGPFAKLDEYKLEHPLRPRPVSGKLFIKEFLGLTSMQVSMNKLPAGVEVPFYHQHKENEELYIFVKGKGQMQIDGQIIDVQEGSLVRITPGGTRTWRNNSNEDLYYIVLQAKEGSLRQDTFDDGVPVEKQVSWINAESN